MEAICDSPSPEPPYFNADGSFVAGSVSLFTVPSVSMHSLADVPSFYVSRSPSPESSAALLADVPSSSEDLSGPVAYMAFDHHSSVDGVTCPPSPEVVHA